MKDRILNIILWAAIILYILLVFSNSFQSAEESIKRSKMTINIIERFLEFFNIHVPITQRFIRKMAHYVEYTLLGIMLYVGFLKTNFKRKKPLVLTLVFGAIIPILDEFIQFFSPGRKCSFADMLIDFTGILTGALFIFFILKIIRT